MALGRIALASVKGIIKEIIKEISGVMSISLEDAVQNGLLELKAYGGTEQGLPYGYIPIQYVNITARSYLLTDIVPTYSGRYELDIKTTTLADGGATTYLGVRPSSSGNGGLRFARISTKVFRVYGFGSYADSTATTQDDTEYKFIWNNQNAKIMSGDTIIYENTFSDTGTCSYPICINGWNSAGTVTAGSEAIYVYSFKALDGQGNLVANYIPCIYNDTVGFYDTVSESFKGATQGTFEAGPSEAPAPDAPVDIVSNNGALKYGAIGKNILDMDDRNIVLGKYINDSGDILDSNLNFYNKKYIEVKPSTTYTRSVSKNARYISIMEYDESRTFVQRTLFDNGSSTLSNQVTTTANTKYILLGSNVESKIITLAKIRSIDRQIEEGETATTYEAYVGGIYTEGITETISSYGANLFNYEEVSDINRYITSSTGAAQAPGSGTFRCSGWIPVKGGTKYFFGITPFSASSAGLAWYEDRSVSTYISGVSGNTLSSVNMKAKAPGNAKYVRFSIRIDTGYDTNWANTVYMCQCEDNTPIISRWQPYYSGGTATAEMLLKIGDDIDEQEILSGAITRKIGVKVLDGTETWSKTAARPNTYVSSQVITDRDVSKRITFCSHFISTDVNDNLENPGYFVVGASTQTISFSLPTSITSGTKFGEWLTDQYMKLTPVIILYVLDTPTTEIVTGQTINIPTGYSDIEITQASLDTLALSAKYKALPN